MEYEFKPGEYKTRNGQKATVLGRHPAQMESPLVGWIEGQEYWSTWREDGRRYSSCKSVTDLMPPTRKAWLNLYPSGPGTYRNSRKEADDLAEPSRIGCIELEIPA